MMSLISGKHIVDEINGVRCTVVEAGLDKQRADFLSDILTFNGFKVEVAEVPAKVEGEAATLKLGVTDIIFNPMISVYQKRLRRKDGKVVTPAYWRQEADQTDIPYFLVKR
jgi:hypothetical protein